MQMMMMRNTAMQNKLQHDPDKNKVLLGLSGGVDSTTAAFLLQKQGYDVYGFYFDVTGCNQDGQKEAQKVADEVGIPLFIEDVSRRFQEIVVENFCSEYLAGRTPNPCIICNPAVKFHYLLAKANEIGAKYIATGHYAQVVCDAEREKYYVKQGANQKKDQSYMLCRLGQDVLSRLLLPLGSYSDKEEVRSLARSQSLSNAEKKDSQEICFIPDDDYAAFLENLGCSSSPGDFVDGSGKVLGRHKGITHYTIGQRKGLGIALGKPAFVTKIDVEKNQVVLGENEELFSTRVRSVQNVFAVGADPRRHCYDEFDGLQVEAKVRYSAKPSPAVLHILDEDVIETEFEEPQRAATPGQSVVWYVDGRVIGGGYIEKQPCL